MRIRQNHDAHLQWHEPNNLSKKRTDLWWCRVSRDLNDEEKHVHSNEILKACMDDALLCLFDTWIKVEVQIWIILQWHKWNKSKTIGTFVLYVMEAWIPFLHWEASRWIISWITLESGKPKIWLHCMVSLMTMHDKYHHDDGETQRTAVHWKYFIHINSKELILKGSLGNSPSHLAKSAKNTLLSFCIDFNGHDWHDSEIFHQQWQVCQFVSEKIKLHNFSGPIETTLHFVSILTTSNDRSTKSNHIQETLSASTTQPNFGLHFGMHYNPKYL